MQVTQTKSEGLAREYAVVVTAGELEAKSVEKLEAVRADFQMKGFRKGKAPLPLLKKMFGKSLMGEVVQESVEEALKQHLDETGERPAQQPDVKIVNEQFEDGDDLSIEIKYECIPAMPEVDWSGVAIERRVVEIDDAAVDEALEKLAASAESYEPRDEGAAAEEGDQVLLDFEGSIDGVPFDGGKGEDFPLKLGSGSFIPGFEDQLIGVTSGESRDVTVSFPENYGNAELAGKEAVFACTAKEVRKPVPAPLDDALAQKYGAGSLDELKGQIRERLAAEFAGAARQLLKRRLLDVLDEKLEFELPEGLVEAEAKSVAHQLWHDDHPEDQGHEHPEIEPDDEHRKIASRRVKLALFFDEIGKTEKIEVSEQDMAQAVMEQARNYPGQEREFIEFIRSNQQMLAQIRAPLFEDKVVDAIVAKASVTDTPVSREELQKEIDALDADEKEAEAAAS